MIAVRKFLLVSVTAITLQNLDGLKHKIVKPAYSPQIHIFVNICGIFEYSRTYLNRWYPQIISLPFRLPHEFLWFFPLYFNCIYCAYSLFFWIFFAPISCAGKQLVWIGLPKDGNIYREIANILSKSQMDTM